MAITPEIGFPLVFTAPACPGSQRISDALSFIYRRHLELRTEAEAYPGEAGFYDELIGIIDPRRENLGQTPGCEALSFYRAATHDHWQL